MVQRDMPSVHVGRHIRALTRWQSRRELVSERVTSWRECKWNCFGQLDYGCVETWLTCCRSIRSGPPFYRKQQKVIERKFGYNKWNCGIVMQNSTTNGFFWHGGSLINSHEGSVNMIVLSYSIGRWCISTRICACVYSTCTSRRAQSKAELLGLS